MGACLSCLGLGERPSGDGPSETERLLYDENTGNRAGYGAAGQGQNVAAPDPEELRRHREMLEQICAETANNLIDVQHTNLLTLRGKPSAEFTKLLNTHFAADTAKQQPEVPEPPKTPVQNVPSTPPEPPSPFTQAQLHAAAQNGRSTMAPATFASISEHPSSDSPQSAQKQKPETPQRGRDDEDDGRDPDEVAEEEWLASLKAKDPTLVQWDQVKQPSNSLIVDLGPDDEEEDQAK